MKQAKILVVDDDQSILHGLNTFLTSEGFAVKTVDCGDKFLEVVKAYSPDLILLDINLGDSNGYDLKEQLNNNVDNAEIPVIFISVNKSLDYKRHGFVSGASDYIVKPFDLEDLVIRIDSILTRRKFYENMYMRDTLTGLYNRPHFEKQARILLSLSIRYGKQFSIVIIDIDGLKSINDQYGHEAGDFIIKATGSVIKKTTRRMDIPIRYGSDEFIVLLPETSSEQAHMFLNRLKKDIKAKEFKYKNKKKINFNVNAGSATSISGEVDIEKMLSIADQNMQKEKQSD
jgi:diguanylate cyclase (GGDEF)-like protein